MGNPEIVKASFEIDNGPSMEEIVLAWRQRGEERRLEFTVVVEGCSYKLVMFPDDLAWFKKEPNKIIITGSSLKGELVIIYYNTSSPRNGEARFTNKSCPRCNFESLEDPRHHFYCPRCNVRLR